MVSLPTPRCVLIFLAISSRLASTGTTVSPVAALSSSKGYKLKGSLVATMRQPLLRRMGKSDSRCTKRAGKSFKRLRSTSASTRSNEFQPHLFGQGPQGGFFGQEPKLHGGLVQAHPLGLGSARLFKLLGIQETLTQ